MYMKSIARPLLSRIKRYVRARGIPIKSTDLRLRLLRDVHRGETCFVLGSGPSLSFSDMDLLKDRWVIGVNKIYLAYPHTRLRPSYHVVADKRIAGEVAPYMQEIECPKFVEEWASEPLSAIPGLLVLRPHPERAIKFSNNLLSGTVGGATVLFTALQVAYYLGFSRVVLLGLDFSYAGLVPTGEISPSGEVLVTSSIANHFVKDYSSANRVASAPRYEEQRAAFAAAYDAYNKAGRILVNASRQTALDVIPRARLEDFL